MEFALNVYVKEAETSSGCQDSHCSCCILYKNDKIDKTKGEKNKMHLTNKKKRISFGHIVFSSVSLEGLHVYLKK